jgi:hypothetical protein
MLSEAIHVAFCRMRDASGSDRTKAFCRSDLLSLVCLPVMNITYASRQQPLLKTPPRLLLLYRQQVHQ